MSRYLSNCVAAVCGNTVTKALATVADGNDALGVTIPANVVDATRDDMVFAFCIDGLDGVPDADSTSDVTGSDVEAGRGKAGDGGMGGVASVLFRLGRVVDIAEEDGFAGLFIFSLASRDP